MPRVPTSNPRSLPRRGPLSRAALELRRRPPLRRALVGAAALLLGALVQSTVAAADAARAAWGERRTVLVATTDLAPGEPVGRGDLRAEERPVAALPPGALGEVPPGAVVRSLVLEGEVLTRRRLGAGSRTGVAALLPAGTRAVSIPVEPGTAPPLEVGQLVDVVAVSVDGDGRARSAVLVPAAEVVEAGESAATVAVPVERVGDVVAALAAGAVSLVVLP